MRNKSTLTTFKKGDLGGNRFDFPGGLKIFIFPKDVHDYSGLLLVKNATQCYTSATKNPPSRWILWISFFTVLLGKTKKVLQDCCAATDEQLRHVDILFRNYYNLQSVHFK